MLSFRARESAKRIEKVYASENKVSGGATMANSGLSGSFTAAGMAQIFWAVNGVEEQPVHLVARRVNKCLPLPKTGPNPRGD